MPTLRAAPVQLTASERKTLKERARGHKTAHRDRQRAQIVLLAARAWPTAVIARRLGITEDTARKWRGRFAARGLPGLADLPRTGAPRRISALERAEVCALACQLPAATGVPLARWSCPELAAELASRGLTAQISVSSVRRILAENRSSPGGTSRGSSRGTRTSPPGRPSYSTSARAFTGASRWVQATASCPSTPGPPSRPAPAATPLPRQRPACRCASSTNTSAGAPWPCSPRWTCTPARCRPPARGPPGSPVHGADGPDHAPGTVQERWPGGRRGRQRGRRPRQGRHQAAEQRLPELHHDPHAGPRVMAEPSPR